MQRRHFLRNTGLAAGALALGHQKVLAALAGQQEYKITMLRNDAGIFTEKGGTILFHASKKGLIVVDSQFPDQAGHLIAELKKMQDKPVDLLINTHHHGDHTGGNIAFKGIAKKVVGHENCLSNYKRVTEEKKDADKQLFQDTTFTDTWTEKVAGEKIMAHYFGAGHTSGDALIHFENANVVHVGDLMFNRVYPFIDRKAGASFKNWINVLDKARKTFQDKDTIFVFGHGSNNAVTGTANDLAGLQNYIEKLLATVQDAIKAGKSKDEILAIPEIAGVGEWKDEFKLVKVNLEVAYAELTS
jgi:glyoxylase-like metal-dependent hydrolase (beta-lactamase superfamily II)